jgi:hypothetical protein
VLRQRLGLHRVELGLGDRSVVEQLLGLFDFARRTTGTGTGGLRT